LLPTWAVLALICKLFLSTLNFTTLADSRAKIEAIRTARVKSSVSKTALISPFSGIIFSKSGNSPSIKRETTSASGVEKITWLVLGVTLIPTIFSCSPSAIIRATSLKVRPGTTKPFLNSFTASTPFTSSSL
jgi:hypothetical protein